MKTSMPLWLALIAASSPTAWVVAQEPGHRAATAQPAPAAALNDTAADRTKSTEGDRLALGLLGAVNEHEIAAARQAQSKKVSGAVLDYARMMQKDHGENQARTKAFGPLSDGAEVRALKVKGEGELASLGTKSGAAYAKAYIDAMVKGHTDALDLIDRKMIPAATGAAVKEHLTKTRAHVADHLERARAIAAKP